MSTTLLQISVNFSASSIPRNEFCKTPRCCHSLSRSKIVSLHQTRFQLNRSLGGRRDGVLVKSERWKTKKKVVLVKGLGFNGGGGGGGDNGVNRRLLGNIALAVGLTYLSLTGQIGLVFDAIGWVVDTVVSISFFLVLIPILGLGAFIWWAGRDMIQSSCPNCGHKFQIFKTLSDEVLLCPNCTQPFSVEGNEFVRDPVTFSNESPTFGQMFNDFSRSSKKGKKSSAGVVDIEAEVKDAD